MTTDSLIADKIKKWKLAYNSLRPDEHEMSEPLIGLFLKDLYELREQKPDELPINDNGLVWQTRDKFPVPTNPLQELTEILTRTSRDTSEDKMIAAMYGIIVGWDDASYAELKTKHNWSNENIQHQKQLHLNYNKAWNLFATLK